MAKKKYDVIVVGTGAGGGMAMKTLCEAGLQVLALNSGANADPVKDFKSHTLPYDLPFRGRLSPDKRKDRYPCERETTTQHWEHEIDYVVAPGSRWRWPRASVVGGKANFWGRSSPRFADIDFNAASIDGFDVDWPITTEEIAPYYSRVERMIGVASTAQNRPSNPDGDYLSPIPFRCLDYILQRGASEIGVPYLPDRIAQLTTSIDGRMPCHYCGGCTSGCDTGSFFSPLWFTIPAAAKTGNLALRTSALVREVLVDKKTGRARGVAYVDRETRQEVEVEAKAVVLAASCCETAKIMLNSKSRQWPSGIANSSGELGRNLSDHLYGQPAAGYLPQLLGQPSQPDNVSHSTVAWMPRWQNLRDPHEEKFIRGYSVYPGGGCSQFPSYYSRFEGFGSSFKREVKRHYPTPISFLIQAPSLPSPSNYLDIDPHVTDAYGIPAARFHFEWGENELLMWEHAKEVCAELLRKAGGEVWVNGKDPSPPGTSLHETGPCRFGNDAKRFVTNSHCQTHDVDNLFVCDASVFPFATDKTSTLSILAFTMRTSDYMIDLFKRNEL